jgi:prepilin-type N-terminal cleavage/methylation domain-containing protein
MKKAFTLIELIFVIVIIGLLASLAIPHFKNLTTHAKNSGVKSVVTSIQSSIDNIHGQWIVNDSYNWDPDNDGNSNLNNEGYPTSLDSGKDEVRLFRYVLKIPVPACTSKTSGCWKEYEDNKYEYYYTPSKILKIEYNATSGVLECLDGDGITKSECQEIIY